MIASSSSSPPTRIDCETTIPPSEITATSLVPPPMSTTMLPVGSPTGRPAPMAAAIGSSIRYAWRAPALRHASSTARFSTPVTPEGTQTTTRGCAQRFWCTFWMKWRSISSVTSKSAITPSFSGRMAEIAPGVRPSIRLASMPTAWTSPVRESIATLLGSGSTKPRPRTETSVLAVPRSTAMSRPPKPVRYEKKPMRERTATAPGPRRQCCGGRDDRDGQCIGRPLRACRPERPSAARKMACKPASRRPREAPVGAPGPPAASCRERQQVRPELEQRPDREPDDVEVVALDPLDERAAAALDGVAAGALLPLAAAQVPVEHRLVERAERDARGRRRGADGPVLRDQRHAADDLVRAAAEAAQRVAGGVLARRLAPDVEVDGDERVDAEHDLAAVRPAPHRLAQRVLARDGDRDAVLLLDDVDRPDLERDAEALEDRAALGRAAGEDQLRVGHRTVRPSLRGGRDEIGEEEPRLALGRLG